MSTFMEVALSCVQRGWHVFPCWPATKKPMTPNGFLSASGDEAQIHKWWSRCPDANVAIACGASGIAVLDVDHGLKDQADFVALSSAMGLPGTYAVRTGRRDDYGVQVYFSGTIPDVGDFRVHGCNGQIKSQGGYVMAVGSVHPVSGEKYEVLQGSADALAPLPESVRALKSYKPTVPVGEGPMEKIPEGAGRHAALTSVAGKLRNSGLDKEAICAALIPLNESMCAVPVSDDDLEHIAQSVCRYAVPEPEPIAIIGGKKATAQVVDVEDADGPETVPRPKYPDDVWEGTPYGEFADMCTRDNYVPKKLFSESMRTVVGAIVGDRLSCPLTGVSPRMYTIKIAKPGSGKGTSDERVRDLFCSERWEGLQRTEAPMLWSNPQEFIWRGRGIGAQVVSPASAPGLIKAIEERKPKKGETVNPLETWRPMPRVITMSEEMRGLFANFANESTGAGLESVLCELYDRDSFTSTATKDRGPASGKLMYSLLGGITKEGWDSVFSKVESVESGFLSRVNIVGTEEDRTVAGLKAPNFETLRNKIFPVILDLEKNPRTLDAAPSAMAYMDRWYSRLELPEGISRARLNVHAWRTALHLAWLHGHGSILEADVDGGIRIAEYQAKMREFYAPPEGETRGARCEAAIRKVVTGRRRMTVRELKQRTNYKRFGIGLWDKSLQGLVKAGEVRIQESDVGRKTVILLKTKG